MTVVLVAVGAAIGAPLRYVVDHAVRVRFAAVFPRAFPRTFPWGTLVVNVAGSAVLGFLIAFSVPAPWLAFAGTGFCGALTTYSTFGYETVRLAESGAWALAGVNVAAGITAGIGAAYGGVALAQAFGG